jgi:hypothetical protein
MNKSINQSINQSINPARLLFQRGTPALGVSFPTFPPDHRKEKEGYSCVVEQFTIGWTE